MKTLFLTLDLLAAFADVTFLTDVHCKKCVEKMEENLAFEKGVKDLKVNLKDKTVYVRYDSTKTNVEQLRKAINKLGYKAEVMPASEEKNKENNTK